MIIRDHGIGMSNFREGALGYGLIRSLVAQISGELEVRSDTGMMARISFTVPPQRAERGT